mmetsp:Transcript_138802/g.241365  ORF Transcript_138802/g.241365 Transcript_138802/m.241365 type:complete len:203 (+) Transcript_138802:1227-1835(+)
MDKARHDANFTGLGFDNSRAIWTNEPCLRLRLEHSLDTNHIQLRNTFSNANNEWNLRFESLFDRLGSSRWWDINDGSVSTCGLHALGNVGENWQANVGLTSFLRIDATNHFRAICNGLFRVERAMLPCQALTDNFRVGIDENLLQKCTSALECHFHRMEIDTNSDGYACDGGTVLVGRQDPAVPIGRQKCRLPVFGYRKEQG